MLKVHDSSTSFFYFFFVATNVAFHKCCSRLIFAAQEAVLVDKVFTWNNFCSLKQRLNFYYFCTEAFKTELLLLGKFFFFILFYHKEKGVKSFFFLFFCSEKIQPDVSITWNFLFIKNVDETFVKVKIKGYEL